MKIRNATDRGRTIAATGVTVGPGEVVEVDDVLGKSLCAQTDVWRESKATKAIKATKEND